jgi:hypothetical protein
VVLALFLAISWLLCTLAITLPRYVSRRESIFLFMVILNVHISVSWLFVMEMKKVVVSQQVPEYLAYILHRSVFVPAMVLLFTNLLLFRLSFVMKTLIWVAYGLVWLLLEKLGVAYGVYTFPKWTVFHSLLLYYPYLLISVYLLKWYRAFIEKKVVSR